MARAFGGVFRVRRSCLPYRTVWRWWPLFAALGLSACGRKGPLDAPPAALNSADAGTEVPASEQATVLRQGSATALPDHPRSE